MSLRYSLLMLGMLAALAGALHGWLHQPATSALPETASSPGSATPLPPAPPQTRVQDVDPVAASDLAQALDATSLANLSIPHSLTVDAAGNLIVDEGTRELMDFFLALDGELDEDDIRALFSSAAHTQCASACAEVAVELFDRYREYLQQMQEQQADWMALEDLRARLNAVIALRHQLLGAALSEALFGYEEQYDDLRIQQWEIRQNGQLTEADKQAQLDALAHSGPADLLERDQANQQWQQLRQLSQQPDTLDGADLYQSRQQLVGAAAAERLAQLDDTRMRWEQRYQQYRDEAELLTTAALTAEDRSQQLAELREQYFNSQEIMRVAALDRIRSTSAP